MDCLHPTISQRLTPLIVSISAERRHAVLRIAKQAANWEIFVDILKQGDFRLPTSSQTNLSQITQDMSQLS